MTVRVHPLRRLLSAALAVVAMAGSVVSASAGGHEAGSQETVTTSEDAYVTAEFPSRNFGAEGVLRVGGFPRTLSFLRFEVPDSVGDIDKATLSIFVKRGARTGIAVRQVGGGGWNEQDVTYRNAPAPGGVIAQRGRVRGRRWASFDVTSAVFENATVDLVLTSSGGTTVVAASSERARGPRLMIERASASPPPTSPPPADPAVIAAAGDIACDPASSAFNNGNGTATQCRQRHTSDLLVGRALDAVLTLGDNQYEYGSLSQFQASYDPSWGRVKSITHPALGNHEYEGPDGSAAGYFDYFGPAGARNEGWYSFRVGAWNLIALNSACEQVGGCAIGSAQVNWLTNELRRLGGACTLVYWHVPLFSSGYAGSSSVRDLWRVLYEHNADVVLNGHEHFYERFAPQDASGNRDDARGIRQFTVGTGGKGTWGFANIKPNSESRGTEFGVLEMTLRPGAYSWRFLPAAGGSFGDSGSDVCH